MNQKEKKRMSNAETTITETATTETATTETTNTKTTTAKASRWTARYIAGVAMLSAVAFILQYIEIAIPMIMPGFIKFDFYIIAFDIHVTIIFSNPIFLI